MVSILVYTAVSFVLFSLFLALASFKAEMKKRMAYQDYIDEAVDGVYNDFASNRGYSLPASKGLVFYREGGKIRLKGQSRLCGTRFGPFLDVRPSDFDLD